MNFRQAFYFFTFSSALWAFVTLAIFAQLHTMAIVIFIIGYLLTAFRRPFHLRISNFAWLIISLLVIVFALYGWFILWEHLYSVVYTFLYLEINKLWTAEKNKDYLQVYGLTFFQMLAASVSTASVLFAPALMVYLFLILGALITLTIKRDAELAFTQRRIRKHYRTHSHSVRLPEHEQRRLKSLSQTPYMNRFFLRRLVFALISILIIGGGMFYIIPRLQVQSFVSGLGPSRSATMISGFSDTIDFVGMGEIQTDTAIAARAIPDEGFRFEDGYPMTGLMRLRGTSLDHYDGRRWDKSSLLAEASQRVRQRHSVQFEQVRYDKGDSPVKTTIHLEPNTSGFLFAPGRAIEYRFDGRYDFRTDPLSDSLQIMLGRWHSTLSYSVTSILPRMDYSELLEGTKPQEAKQAEEAIDSVVEATHRYMPRLLMRRLTNRYRHDGRQTDNLIVKHEIDRFYLQLPDHPDIQTVRRLAEEWTEETDNPADTAKKIEMQLKRDYGYSLDVSFSQSDTHLTEFLTNVKKGHCEYFATAMVLMLRTQGIPARIVNGYATDEWVRGSTGYFIVRKAHAHSWVEVYNSQFGWMTYDPTPITGIGNNRLPSTLFRNISRWFDSVKFHWYDKVIDYDLQDQTFLYRAIFRGMDLLPEFKEGVGLGELSPNTSAGRKRLLLLSIGIALAVAVYFLVREIRDSKRTQKKKKKAIQHRRIIIEPYMALLNEADRRVQRAPGETPLEYARAFVASHKGLQDFLPLTQRYYDARFNNYSWSPSDTERANALLHRLKTQSK